MDTALEAARVRPAARQPPGTYRAWTEMPPIPGSSMIPPLQSAAPRLTVQSREASLHLAWSRAAVGFTLEASDAVGPDAQWTPILTGIQTNVDTFNYATPEVAAPQFFRLRR